MKAVLLFLAVVTSGLATHAQAEAIGGIVTDVTSVDTQQKYAFNSKIGAYELKQSSVRIIGQATGSGAFGSVNQSLNKTDSRVTGVDYKGYQRLAIVEKDNKLFLRQTVLVNDTVDGAEMKMTGDAEVEMVVTSGSIADFKAGKRVELAMTEEGKKKWLAEALRSSDEALRTALSKALPGYKLTTTVQKVEISPQARFTVDADQIVAVIPTYRLIFTVTVSN